MKRSHEGKSQNPLFMKWLSEIKQEATNGDIMAYNVGKAMMSLQKCPNKLKTVNDCLDLKFFGKKICEILNEKLEEYKKANNHRSSDNDDLDDENVGGKRAKKNDKVARNKLYIPVKVDSSAYVILSIMYKHKQGTTYPGYMLRKNIISEAQKYIDYQMKNNADEDFSFWPAMSTLIAENYVIQKSSTLFSITDSGANIIGSSLIFENAPNPLFVKWLAEMNEKAVAKKSKNQLAITKLLIAFQKCPIRLNSAKDYMDFDSMFNYNDELNLKLAEEIFNKLDRKLEQYNKTNNLQSNSDGEDVGEQTQKADKEPNRTGRKTKARGGKK